jgi:glucosamine-6-phosphate deaminase
MKTVRYFKSIERVQEEVEEKYGGAAVRKSRINGVH